MRKPPRTANTYNQQKHAKTAKVRQKAYSGKKIVGKNINFNFFYRLSSFFCPQFFCLKNQVVLIRIDSHRFAVNAVLVRLKQAGMPVILGAADLHSAAIGLTMCSTLQIKSELAERVDLSAKHLNCIKRVLDKELGDCHGAVYIFGSRAEGRALPTSDIDLAVEGDCAAELLISRLQTGFEESDIPFTVDIVDLTSSSPAFVASVKKEGTLLWEN